MLGIMANIDPVAELEKRLATDAYRWNRAKLAREIGVSRQYLYQVLNKEVPPSEKVLGFLGLQEKVIYQRQSSTLVGTGS
jgi:hypothetical protein